MAVSSPTERSQLMKLGVDSYSLRWQGWDAFRLLDYASALGLDNVHFSERTALASLDVGYLRALRERAEALGLSLELGMLSFDQYSSYFRPAFGRGERQLSDMLRAAQVVGSPIVRAVLGGQAERLGPPPIDQHVDEVVRVLRMVAPLARDLGVKVALENHGALDLLARELRSLVQTVGTEVVGVCLDAGNPAYAAEDPVVSTEILAPYLLSTQIRDTRVWSAPAGAMAQWVPMGQGNVDLRRLLGVLREHAPEISFNLEIITGLEPRLIPYAEPSSDFWAMYPHMLACDFVRFVMLAHSGAAEPFGQLVLAPGTDRPAAGAAGEALREQQRSHFEESVRYCRQVLGFGQSGSRAVVSDPAERS
jgi:3-oxoisoapionate decarboxylase